MSPLLQRMAQHPQLDISTVYCRLRGAKAGIDPEFGAKIQWDIPLLDGYPWVEIPNKGTDSEGFWGLYNPGLWRFVRQGNFDAVFCHTGYIRAFFWITYLASKLSRSAFLFGTDATKLTPLDRRMWKRPVKRLFWPVLYRLASGHRSFLRNTGFATFPRGPRRTHQPDPLCRRQRLVECAIGTGRSQRRPRLLGGGS